MENLKENNQETQIAKQEAYTAPSIEVLEVVVEKGFLVSPGGDDSY